MRQMSVSGEGNLHRNLKPKATYIYHFFACSVVVHKVILRYICIRAAYRNHSGIEHTRDVMAYRDAINTRHLNECFQGKYVDSVNCDDIPQRVEANLLVLTRV